MQVRAEIECLCIDYEGALASLEVGDRDGKLIDILWLERCPLLKPLVGQARFAAVVQSVRTRAAAVSAAFGLVTL